MPSLGDSRVLAFHPKDLFDLVLDINAYPEFLPWCVGARVLEHHPDYLIADLVIGYKALREKYTSKVSFDADALTINVDQKSGPFNYLRNNWQFKDHARGCEIEFTLDFEFRSRILDKMIGGVFSKASEKMIESFELRANAKLEKVT